MDTLHLQSDLSTSFEAAGFKHQLLAGIDLAREEKTVYGARNAAQGGWTSAKPYTTVGTPDDGAWVDEASRVLRKTSDFESTAWGVYAQDMVQVAPHWKLVAGLRFDGMHGDYNTYSIPSDAAGPVTTAEYEQSIYKWSKRFGVLYQPNALQSFHFSWGTSFNTSGDTYSYNASTVNTPPEKSQNIEIGARIDSADKRFTNRFAIFRSTKLNERNTDPSSTSRCSQANAMPPASNGTSLATSHRAGKCTAPTCGCPSPRSTRARKARKAKAHARRLPPGIPARYGAPTWSPICCGWAPGEFPQSPAAQPQSRLVRARLRDDGPDGRVPCRRRRS